jgi:hypothetical protein
MLWFLLVQGFSWAHSEDSGAVQFGMEAHQHGSLVVPETPSGVEGFCSFTIAEISYPPWGVSESCQVLCNIGQAGLPCFCDSLGWKAVVLMKAWKFHSWLHRRGKQKAASFVLGGFSRFCTRRILFWACFFVNTEFLQRIVLSFTGAR